MEQIRIDRSRVILTLLALVIFTSPMFAAGINVSTTAITVNCNLQTSTSTALAGAPHPVTVTLAASPASTVTIGTSISSPSTSPLVVTPNAGTTLAATTGSGAIIYSTGIVFNVTAQQFCANATAVGSNSVTFNFTGTGGLTSSTITVTLIVAGGAYAPAVTPSTSLAISCNTASGPGAAQSINVALAAAPPSGATVGFAAGTYVNNGTSGNAAASGLVVTVPATTLNGTTWSQGINVSINAQPYCANSGGAGTTTQTFTLTGTVTGGPTGLTVSSQVITVSLTVTAGPSPLTVSPSAISINCTWDGGGTTSGHYTPGQPQFISVTGPASAGLTWSVNSSAATSTALAWATLSPVAATISGITASATPYNFTIAPSAGCGAFNGYASHQGTIHLTNGSNLDKVINVTLNIVPATPLRSTLSAASLTYIKGSGTPGYLDVAISAITGNTPYYFTVDTTSLPTWLTVDSTAGTTPRSLRFSSTSIADTMAPGAYSKQIRIQTASYGDLLVTIPMQVSNPPSTLAVSGTPTTGCTVSSATQSCSWVIGQPLPTLYITLKSTDAPIAYTITTGGNLAPIIPAAELAGLAYSFGTTIPVTFSQNAFSGVAPGTMVSGTVSITSGNPSTTYVVTFNITAQAPGAILTGVSPNIVPVLAAGQQVQVVLIGSGFVKSTDPTQATTVGIVNGSGAFVTDTNLNVNVLNASNILVTITVPSTPDPLLNFATTSTFPVTIGVCNPAGSTCTIPTGTTTLTIGAKPIIQTVTSASSYVQSNSYTPVAPYDMISIFGTNLCSTCVGNNTIMYGAPQSPNLGYPTSLSNVDPQNVTRTLQVAFQTHAATPNTNPATVAGPSIGSSPVYAPLLFATNNQINLLVPSAISAAIASGNSLVDLVVSFGTTQSAVLSNAYPLTAVVSNPGLFTIGASGQGNGAILDRNYLVVGQNNPVAMHSAATSDPVMIYMTGLGAPTSNADNTVASPNNSGNGYAWSADCIAPTGATGYNSALGSVTGVTPSSVDGLILQSSLLNTGRFVPCMDSTNQLPVVKIGGVSATPVKYAGWVADSIAGLYQVNATLPSTTGTFYTATADCVNYTGAITNVTQPTQLPVCVQSCDGTYSQPGVMVWVAPRLVVDAPTAASGTPATLQEKVGAPASGTGHAVIAHEGSGSGYTYAITSGVLPSGLSLSSGGTIAGTPAMGTVGSYPVTVTATDTSTPAITGTVSFTVAVGAGLFVSSTVLTTGTVNSTAWSGGIVATGGAGPYTYERLSGTMPAGLTLNTDGTVTGTPTGSSSATVVFRATDANGVTGTVSVTFNIT
jgi:hypothetical protein